MVESIIGMVFGTILYSVFWLFLSWYLFYAIWYRKKFITVHEFEYSDKEYPNFIKRLDKEKVLNYARSFTYSNQFFLSNIRFVINYNSMLRGKTYTKYYTAKSVNNTEITYKNPYIWLIYAGIVLIYGIVVSAKSSGTSRNFYREESNDAGLIILIILGFLVIAGLFVLLWYYTRGYYLSLDNGKVSGIFCRSSEGLENILKTFDKLKLSNDSFDSKDDFRKSIEQVSKDVTCSECKSVLTLEGDDLKSETYVCPVCKAINAV